jgi:hypothetical protein
MKHRPRARPPPTTRNIPELEYQPKTSVKAFCPRKIHPTAGPPKRLDASQTRGLAVLPALAQELRTHLQGCRQSYLFESNRHTLYSVRTVQAVVERFARQAGIAKRVYPHLLRH